MPLPDSQLSPETRALLDAWCKEEMEKGLIFVDVFPGTELGTPDETARAFLDAVKAEGTDVTDEEL